MFPIKKVQSLVGNRIQVEMKGEKNILEGILMSSDDYLNIHIAETMEVCDGERVRSLGSVVLRGNNIVLLVPLDE